MLGGLLLIIKIIINFSCWYLITWQFKFKRFWDFSFRLSGVLVETILNIFFFFMQGRGKPYLCTFLLYYATTSKELCIIITLVFSFAASASHYNQKTAAIFLLQLIDSGFLWCYLLLLSKRCTLTNCPFARALRIPYSLTVRFDKTSKWDFLFFPILCIFVHF